MNAQESALACTMKSLDGTKDISLAETYKGKVVLMVNTASKCGLTPQYKGLQKLHETFAEKGLAVLGFPCNQFGKQEPGSAQEIGDFCSVNYGVTFDLFAKIDVNGESACGLYKYLCAQKTTPAESGVITWNFEKFLIGRDGKIIARFGPKTAPDDATVLAAISKALSAK